MDFVMIIILNHISCMLIIESKTKTKSVRFYWIGIKNMYKLFIRSNFNDYANWTNKEVFFCLMAK